MKAQRLPGRAAVPDLQAFETGHRMRLSIAPPGPPRTMLTSIPQCIGVAAWLLAATVAGTACRKTEEPPRAPPPPVAVAAPPPPPANDPAPAYPPCGDPGQPDCPLAAWMDAGPNNFLLAHLMEPLAGALRRLATIAPPGYPGWEAWALDGAASAERGDADAVKRACTGCHDTHRARYRHELRGRPITIPTGAPDAGVLRPTEDDSPAPAKPHHRRN
jgi:hypothetical protein